MTVDSAIFEIEKPEKKEKKPNRPYRFNLIEADSKGRSTIVWNKCVYFDFETAPWTEKFHESNETELGWLDIRECGIVAYTLIVPSEYVTKKMYRIPYVTWQEADGFVIFQHYDENRRNVIKTFMDLVDRITFHIKQKVFMLGFNNEKFDNLAFAERLKENVSCYRWCRADGKETNLYVADIIYWAKAYGFNTLAQVGKYLGVNKIEDWNSLEEYMYYNRIDTQIILNFVKMLNDHGFMFLRPATNARRIMSSEFREALEKDGIPCVCIYSDRQKSDEIPLYGGRTEPYHAYAEDVAYLDVNSLYPYVMSHFLFPKFTLNPPKTYVSEDGKTKRTVRTARIDVYKTPPTPAVKARIRRSLDAVRRKLLTIYRTSGCFGAEVCRRIYEEHMNFYGVLKVRLNGIHEDVKEFEDRIRFYFPFPRRHGIYTLFSMSDQEYYVEFYEVMWLCFFDFEILEIYEFPYTERLPNAERIKERYYRRLELKKKGDEAQLALKIILNSSYGIFATRNRTKERIIEENEYEMCRETWKLLGEPDQFEINFDDEVWKVQTRTTLGKPVFEKITDPTDRKYLDNTIPTLACAITANARFSLYSWFLNAIFWPNADIYYCDTDSIFCNRTLFEHLNQCGETGSELGKLKIEKEKLDFAYFLAPKFHIHSENGVIVKTIRGTGSVFVKKIVSQSMKTEFRIINRDALNPDRPQKRKLVGNDFLPTEYPEISEDLKKLYEFVKDKYP